jgi:pimeloyl-ACP methyl ester carboxylesterase
VHAQEPAARASSPQSAPLSTFTSTILDFKAKDGTPLQARLTLPARADKPPPVVFFLSGAGPRTYDSVFMYRGPDGKPAVGRFLDYHADHLARRGLALFTVSKRGCTAIPEPPGMKVDREVFSRATLSTLVDDYEEALKLLRSRPEIDAQRIILAGASEGTRAAPMLARRSPDGIIGIAMMAFAADNAKDTVEWQNTIGPWRNIQHLVPAARDGALTREEHQAFANENARIAQALPFDALDTDKGGEVNEADLKALNAPRFAALGRAIESRDDEYLWKNLLNLSSAYLLDWWDAPPNKDNLLALDMPLAIFHGDLDGACRVEGVHETQSAFKSAGRSNLTVHLYPDANHDLNWTQKAFEDGGPKPYTDAFDWMAEIAKR